MYNPNLPVSACPQPSHAPAIVVLGLTYTVLVILVILGHPVDDGIQIIGLGAGTALVFITQLYATHRRTLPA